MEFQISFHVQEKDETDARIWLENVTKILGAYRSQLVSPKTGMGAWCSGHVQPSNSGAEPAAPRTDNVISMGPRE